MSTERMAAEFEAWWMHGAYGARKYDRFSEIGLTEDDAMEIWVASRAALAIDLPKPLPSGDYRMTVPFYKAADIIEALSAACIEVKA
jgi:hypothetical protein